jgi:uncharacterized protein
MSIDWVSFTPGSAAIGGAMIGSGAAMLLLLNGRIAGISGIVGGLLQHLSRGETVWRIAFIAGLVLAPSLLIVSWRLPAITIAASYPVLIVAGLLVGIGTRYGSGCTSGHGICGIARLSRRSIVAIACFMMAGFATVFVARHILTG